MKRVLSVIAMAAILSPVYIVHAQENVKADNIVDIAASKVSYNIKATEGEDLVITADYAETRPSPEIENMDISPVISVKDGIKVFKVLSKEGPVIEIQYSYALGERTGINILAEPPNPSSDTEYSQVLSVESTGGYIINFTFIWQGKDLKEVRIEPRANPFTAS